MDLINFGSPCCLVVWQGKNERGVRNFILLDRLAFDRLREERGVCVGENCKIASAF